MTVTITISEKLFNQIKELAEEYEDLPEDFNPYVAFDNYTNDAFFSGVSHGAEELASEIIADYEANKTES